ncbi:MAG TPA: hypothetical protein VGH21_03715 [Solirubrobacteraceae bacterium]
MPQLSRPFQILLAVFVLFAAVWFIALRKHSTSSESSSAPAPSSSAQHTASASSPGGGTPASSGSTYNGSAPGVAGLSRAIQKARGAVAQSQQNANQLQQKSAQASSQTQNGQAQSSSQAQHGNQAQSGQTQKRQTQSAQHNQNSTQAHSPSAKSAPSSAAHVHPKAANGIPAMQATVESELHQGKVVALLFFNPKGSVDASVRRELRRAGSSSHGKLAVHFASAKQVGTFGSFTRTVQVYSTPTILLINKAGVTSSLTGLTDAFSIEQAVREVKAAK